MASNVTTREARTAEGKCSQCLRRKAKAPYTKCGTCLRAANESITSLRDERRRNHQCTLCGTPTTQRADGTHPYLCDEHIEARKAARRK